MPKIYKSPDFFSSVMILRIYSERQCGSESIFGICRKYWDEFFSGTGVTAKNEAVDFVSLSPLVGDDKDQLSVSLPTVLFNTLFTETGMEVD